jgi:hypothetical protein
MLHHRGGDGECTDGVSGLKIKQLTTASSIFLQLASEHELDGGAKAILISLNITHSAQ